VGATVHDKPWPLFYNFLITQTVDRTPWVADQPAAKPLPTTNSINANINASSGIGTRDPSVGVDEGSSYLRPRSHCISLHKILP
jgi:hypothetical protein